VVSNWTGGETDSKLLYKAIHKALVDMANLLKGPGANV
jgi:hypothetical protein